MATNTKNHTNTHLVEKAVNTISRMSINTIIKKLKTEDSQLLRALLLESLEERRGADFAMFIAKTTGPEKMASIPVISD